MKLNQRRKYVGKFSETDTIYAQIPPKRPCEKIRICHWSSMQTERSKPEGERIMPETRFPALSIDPKVGISWSASETSFPALSVYPRVGISLSASEADD